MTAVLAGLGLVALVRLVPGKFPRFEIGEKPWRGRLLHWRGPNRRRRELRQIETRLDDATLHIQHVCWSSLSSK